MNITLNQMRETKPCKSGWERTLRVFGTSKPNNRKISLKRLVDNVGIEDAAFALDYFSFDEMKSFRAALGEKFKHYKVNFDSEEKSLFTEIENPSTTVGELLNFAFGVVFKYCCENEETTDLVGVAKKKAWSDIESVYRDVF